MKNLKRLLLTALFVVIHSIGVAFAMKAAIGVSAFDAFTQTSADVFGIKIGTMGIFVNLIFITLQLIMVKKIKPLILLQIAMALILGNVINFFLYEVLTFEMTSYISRLIIFLIANVVISFAIGGIMAVGLLTYPGEGLALEVSKKFNFEFTRVRFALDIVLIIISLILTFVFKVGLYIREGTIISALTFSPLLGVFQKKLEPIFSRWGLSEA